MSGGHDNTEVMAVRSEPDARDRQREPHGRDHSLAPNRGAKRFDDSNMAGLRKLAGTTVFKRILRCGTLWYLPYMKRPFNHRGVQFVVESTLEDDILAFEFQIGGKTVRGTKQTRLIGVAVRRIQVQIDRALRERAKLEAEEFRTEAAAYADPDEPAVDDGDGNAPLPENDR
jgi:hypothetical protein